MSVDPPRPAGSVTASLRRLLAEAESGIAGELERLVHGRGFASLLGQTAENAVALTTLNAQLWDLVLRNLRLAGRGDIHRLGRRLNHIDDKLEVILQELERLGDGLPAGGPA